MCQVWKTPVAVLPLTCRICLWSLVGKENSGCCLQSQWLPPDDALAEIRRI